MESAAWGLRPWILVRTSFFFFFLVQKPSLHISIQINPLPRTTLLSFRPLAGFFVVVQNLLGTKSPMCSILNLVFYYSSFEHNSTSTLTNSVQHGHAVL